MVPIAHGNDGGGSLRIPAACCGLVGLKPQRGRISMAPEVGEQFLVQDGVLTRTVEETALMLDVLAGHELGDSSWAPPPGEPFAVTASRKPGRLRIGVTTTMPLLEAELDPECEQATRDAAELLAGLGHEIVAVEPPWHAPGLLDLFTAAFGPALCAQIAFAGLLAGREPEQADVEPLSWGLWERSKAIDSVTAQLATLQLQALGRQIVTWAQPYDAILTPALASKPVAIGELDPCGPDPIDTFTRGGHFTPYTAISNVTGSPAISLPLFEHADGLPLAIQLIGRPAQEGALLALATQVEAAHPWAGRRPAVAAR
jgi:amidase